MKRADPKKNKREQIERLTAAYLANGGAIEKVREGKRVMPEHIHKLAFLEGESVAERNRRYTAKRRFRR
jgi:hypothetical protein